ncbi:deazaflavin-dependent oxidoreductase, nitroreductase family [Amycolatopsis arida]|uniref:Deazaflavin-dependent oxidoreductase, nitroreductase family n=1 Tax=Amycolatopsis arida TaxID=587909 RepID=A0A1I5PVZ0_9PSEU|nr:nitroreductase/quinone reductase family protein [Amycolatopsis arida]TDX98614.1 deazaflavin-dependent oxidoreductase (nitroreductase family) [Amycolatopsis arida]SFP37821.1 deazaflavin-dependent oxidoreductase, nitroreductase family [Amycolatopsis arida]
MSQDMPRKQRVVSWFQRNLVNPVARPVVGHLPGQALLETTGRRSGLPRRTPLGGRRDGDTFWFVAEHGTRSQYVRNIVADPTVRLQLRGHWYTGTATPLPDDDARARLRTLPTLNSALVRLLGTDPLTIRVDLDT